MRRWIAGLVFVFAFCSAAGAQSVTGTSIGTWSWTQCPQQWACDIGVQHNATLNLAQNGNGITGTAQFQISYTVTGTLSGSTLSFTLTPTTPNGDLHSTCVVQITGYQMSGPCTQFWNGLTGSWSLTVQLNPLTSNSFSPVVSYARGGSAPQSMDVADVNKDGFPDIVLVNLCFAAPSDCRTSVDVMINNGNGTFQSPLRYATDGTRGNSIAISDVDGDGNPDLAVTNTQYPFPTVSVMRGNGNGTFQPAVSYVVSPSNPNGPVPTHVIAADVNADGKPDLLVALAPVGTGTISVLLNRGDGTFLTPVLFDSGGYQPTDLVAVDINGDGIPDVVVLNRCGSSNCNAGGFGGMPGNMGLLLGNGNGTFQPAIILATGGYSPNALAAVDLNRDGNQDLVVTQCPTGPGTCGVFASAAVLLGDGHGNFGASVNYSAGVYQDILYWIAAGDLDGDGYADVVVVNGCDHFHNCNALSATVSVLRGNGDGTLLAPLLITVGDFPSTVVVADVNGDGKPDIELTTNNGVGVLLNQTPRTPITLDTSPSGLTIFMNGVSDTAPKTYPWAPNSRQQISTNDPQQVTTGSRLKFSSWSDGGALTHNVTVPSSPITYTATFKTQYLLTTNTNPAAGGSITPGDWFDSGSNVDITATAASGYGFAGFSGNLSGTTNPNSITMNAAKTVTANFKGLTTTSLSTSPNPNTFGQSVTMTATVTSPIGTPGGTVTFYDATTSLGNQPLDGSGHATLISLLTTGTHTLAASYAGNVSFVESTSAPVTQTVNKASSSTTVSSSLNPSVAGQMVTFTALVSSTVAVPTGAVAFKDGGTLIGTGILNASGQATLSTSSFNAGNHSITVEYSGDADFLNSSSSTLTQTVNRASTTTTLTSAPNPSSVGQPVTFTATVVSPTGGVPAGTVNFGDGDTALGSSPLDAQGKAVFVTSSLSTRTHLISAVYAGTANYAGSASLVLRQVVALAATNTSVTSSQNPSAVGQSITLTATVTGTGQSTPTGTVTFKVGDGRSLGTATLSGGQAGISISNLKKGTNSIFAVYSGDSIFAGGVSPVYMQVVN